MADKILKWQNAQLDSTNYTVTIGDTITQDNIADILNYKYCGYNSFFNDITRQTTTIDIKYGERAQAYNTDLFTILYGAVKAGYNPLQNKISDSIGFVPHETDVNMARPYWFVSFIATKHTGLANGWLRYNSTNFNGNVFFVKEIKGIKKCFISRYTSSISDGTKTTYDDLSHHYTLNCTCDRDLNSGLKAYILKEDGSSTEYYIWPVLVIVVNNNIYIRTNEIIAPAQAECYDYHYYKPSNAGLPFKNISGAYLWFETNHGFKTVTTTKTFTANGTKGTELKNAEIIPNRIVDDLPIYRYIVYSGQNGLLRVPNAYDNDDNIKGYYNIQFGLYVKDDNSGNIIKPIITGGIVTGWSADLNTESDIDKWTSSSDHEVPDKPPTPTPEGDDDIEKDMSAGVGYYDAGMIRYYFTETTSTLELISTALGNWDNIETGKDVLKNLISLKCFAVPAQTESAGGIIRGFPEDFIIAGTKLKKSSTSSEVIQMKRITSIQNIPLDGIQILPKFNDFRDYAPYTKLEIYVPFCGWMPLPSHCMGRTVSGTICFDYINGSCIAHIYCNNTEVGQISGYIGIDLPFVAENVGVKMAGVVSGMTAIGSSVIGTAAGLATGNALGAAAGGLGLINSITQTIQANNANYTEVHGRTADGCNASGLKSVFIKIQRPISNVPANYGATVGYVANSQQTIADCSGLTVCSNVDTDGISGATASEREKIKALLESGVRV